MTTKNTHGGARPGSGPKPLPPGTRMENISLKMHRAQIEKLHRLGGASWVRTRIDKAKE